MSKKRGNKKNQDFDDDLEEKKDSHDITSKKGKGKKKGKGDDGSDEEKETPARVHMSDEEDFPKPASKKLQKKGKWLHIVPICEIS